MPRSIDQALEWMIAELQEPTKVPEESTIRLLARVNALCARNMNACNWFPHHDKPYRTEKL